MPGCKGTSLPPPANGHCHVALSPECPGAQERDRQAGCCPPPPQLCPTPRRALQGAAGDSSPSELSYVSFLLGWGRGVNQLLGAVRLGQLLFLQLRPGKGVVRGQDGLQGERAHRHATPCPTTHLIFLGHPGSWRLKVVLLLLSIRRE